MLEIYCKGIKLNLADDIQLNFIIENPFTLSDKIPVPYTLAFELPPTPTNLQCFKYPNRTTSFKGQEFKDVRIVFDGVTFTTGMIVLLGFEKRIKVQYKGVNAFESLLKKLGDTPMEEFSFGSATITTNGPGPRYVIDRNSSSNFAYKYRALAMEGFVNHPKFALAPIRIEGTQFQVDIRSVIIPSPPQTVNIDSKLCQISADQMYLNFFNAGERDSNLTTQHVPRGSSVRARVNTRFFPMPYLHYIFDEVFKDTLEYNIFKDGDLQKLVLVTSYHPAYKKIESFYTNADLEGMIFDNTPKNTSNFDPVLKLNSFLPDIQANELLKEVMKLFCMSLYPYKDKFKMVKNKDILNSTVVEKWTNKKIGSLSFEVRKGAFYNYGYDDVEEESEEEKIVIPDANKLNSIQALYTAPVTENDDFSGNFLIVPTGEIFRKEASGSGYIITRLNSGFGRNKDDKKEDQDEFDVVSKISPLPMSIEEYWTDKGATASAYPTFKKWYVPVFTGDRFKRPENIHLMLVNGYQDVATGSTDKYTLLTPHNYNHFGQKQGDFSLRWDGTDGLINRYHKEYKEWQEKEKPFAYGEFLLTATDLKMLDLSIKKNIDNKNFIIEKLNVTVTKNQIKPAIVDFLEA